MKEECCNLEVVFAILKKKKVPAIIWNMKFEPQRQRDLLKNIDGLNERTLILNLNNLLSLGIVIKRDYNVYPKYTDYRLTSIGYQIIRILKISNEVGKKINSEIKNIA